MYRNPTVTRTRNGSPDFLIKIDYMSQTVYGWEHQEIMHTYVFLFNKFL